MKAIQLTENGGSDVMQLRDVPIPEPKEGELLLKIDAAGLNYIDVYQRDGMYPIALPFILGMEGAGTVEAVGAGVSAGSSRTRPWRRASCPLPAGRASFVVS